MYLCLLVNSLHICTYCNFITIMIIWVSLVLWWQQHSSHKYGWNLMIMFSNMIWDHPRIIFCLNRSKKTKLSVKCSLNKFPKFDYSINHGITFDITTFVCFKICRILDFTHFMIWLRERKKNILNLSRANSDVIFCPSAYVYIWCICSIFTYTK